MKIKKFENFNTEISDNNTIIISNKLVRISYELCKTYQNYLNIKFSKYIIDGEVDIKTLEDDLKIIRCK
jgi:hypothetical protein